METIQIGDQYQVVCGEQMYLVKRRLGNGSYGGVSIHQGITEAIDQILAYRVLERRA
jgi:hypothetical protein